MKRTEQSSVRKKAAGTFLSIIIKTKDKNADRLIIPSRKTAVTPAYSLIKAPVAARIRGRLFCNV